MKRQPDHCCTRPVAGLAPACVVAALGSFDALEPATVVLAERPSLRGNMTSNPGAGSA
ncbi:hypothetical protein [Piscinibacter koreensis]|uniref:Uncharacterized protein n=1 Tax=Piscinibacter koreensis TaxID=2742824 RepID=A0A7Y6NKH3_9BURK|nr:hypothetical protein [Schlegelella koreensis]NUZ04769.1 hypothetical protein [Schlegelella koreensis]